MRQPRTSRLFGLAALIAALALVVLALPDLNPFGSETVDRSQPALLKSITRLSEYHAATANLQVIVDLERDDKVLPSFIKGERVLLVAAGNVDAIVDFARPAITVSEDGKGARIVLPPPRLSKARLNLERTRVYDRDRGILDRVESVFEDSPTGDREVLLAAEEKLLAGAREDPELRRAAERNTRQMLEGLLRGLGFERVAVHFKAASAEPVQR